jgi:tetratricopeptide (TPR) repeat protein
VLILKPEYAEAYSNLGNVLKEQEKLDEALACFQRALILKPDDALIHYNLGNTFKDQGKLDEAVASFQQALALKPDFGEAHHSLGLIFRELGKMDDAIACYRKALSLKPDYAKAYRNLSLMVKYTGVDDDIQAMEYLYSKKKETSDTDRIDLGFALGKIFEDLGNYNRAFAYILEANRLKRKSYNYAIQDDHDLFKRIRKTFSPDFLASHHNSGFQDKTPIFILGMPRSGTSLVEQILASHPQVFGAGELAVLVNLTNNVCTESAAAQFPECVLDLDMDVFARMGADYVAQIREYSNEAEYITDKMPHNFLYIGLIRTILPAAKVIHCMRDPMDTCFSIFKTEFAGEHKYAYDMVELGQYYNLYRDLISHWEKLLPGFMYTLRYEELVADQQEQTKSLLDFCNLPWDDACLTFHKTKRRVSTASLAQVRQPIYKDSVGLWKRYEKKLEPLRKAIYG